MRPIRTAVTVFGSLLAAAALIAVAGLPVYVFPRTDDPAPTDVVVVLGPPREERVEEAMRLLDAGLGDALMVSVPSHGKYSAAELDVCTEKHSYPVYCEVPDPFTTRGEARWLRQMEETHGWSSATVITFTPHISRARVRMERCFSGEIRMIAADPEIPLLEWARQYIYQTSGFVKVAFESDC
ncbi:ElyC/SanA/YdcF family protein [Compostimonas suwonensis]|uniref:DUF218 domain-containing protein n=1 Tax=Compostimonas suwonensis TaxID=1048394 RepID=A0A2M9BC54_9MICO|nr:ElyC/SanA/YdcF family protein [Compostimonas suwonensis]PJJ55545.1 DUF218 domain-containing protein [Compostimonas suwonensis]